MGARVPLVLCTSPVPRVALLLHYRQVWLTQWEFLFRFSIALQMPPPLSSFPLPPPCLFAFHSIQGVSIHHFLPRGNLKISCTNCVCLIFFHYCNWKPFWKHVKNFRNKMTKKAIKKRRKKKQKKWFASLWRKTETLPQRPPAPPVMNTNTNMSAPKEWISKNNSSWKLKESPRAEGMPNMKGVPANHIWPGSPESQAWLHITRFYCFSLSPCTARAIYFRPSTFSWCFSRFGFGLCNNWGEILWLGRFLPV